ncbi:class I glutamine amidotransferase-like protein [Clavulina sp. PMI_390]|nr:class I glutamine amidotransferase-like protein [Clavulina sp. PMI_390]
MIKLAILLCDTPVPSVKSQYGNYVDIFRTMLESSLERTRPESSIEWSLDGYDVVQQEYPTDNKLAQYDAVLISGSAASAYDKSLPWTPMLYAYISKLITQFPRIKVFGICFGQQAVAMALGGTCIPNPAGWEVGTYEVQLTGAGKLIFGRDILRIQQMHRDHVPSVPPQFELLGSSPVCQVQGIALSYNRGQPIQSLQDIHVLCVQGHPEFHNDIVSRIIDAREASGVLKGEFVKEARLRASAEHDGIDVIAKAMWDILVPPSPA